MAERRPRTTPPKTKLSKLRQAAKLTQEQLADRAGLTLRTIQRLDQGQMKNPPIRYLTNLALALGCELADIAEDDWLEWTVFDARADQPPK